MHISFMFQGKHNWNSAETEREIVKHTFLIKKAREAKKSPTKPSKPISYKIHVKEAEK